MLQHLMFSGQVTRMFHNVGSAENEKSNYCRFGFRLLAGMPKDVKDEKSGQVVKRRDTLFLECVVFNGQARSLVEALKPDADNKPTVKKTIALFGELQPRNIALDDERTINLADLNVVDKDGNTVFTVDGKAGQTIKLPLGVIYNHLATSYRLNAYEMVVGYWRYNEEGGTKSSGQTGSTTLSLGGASVTTSEPAESGDSEAAVTSENPVPIGTATDDSIPF